MYHPFSVFETLKTSWDIFKKNLITIIVYSIISFVLLALVVIALELIFDSDEFWIAMLMSLIFIFIQAYTTLGLYKLIFTVIDSEYYEFEFKQVLPSAKMVMSYLVVIFISAFIITNCNIAIQKLTPYPVAHDVTKNTLIAVGLYVLLRVMFVNNFIVDDKSGPFESIKQSIQLTQGYLFKVFILLAIVVLLIFLPAKTSQYFPLVSLVIIFTYPFVNIVLAVTYRKLIYSHQDVDDDVAETL